MGRSLRVRARGVRLASCVALAGIVAALTWVGLANDVFHGFQLRAADSAFPRGDLDPRLAVVGVDAHSIAATGVPWPWPRSMDAELVAALESAGARVIVLDVLFSPATSDDAQLAAALEGADAVVGEVVTLAQPGSRGIYRVRDTILPVEPIAASAVVGHTAVIPDPSDGLVRTVPLVVDDGRNFVPALALAAMARLQQVPPVVIVRPGAVQIGRRIVPTTRQGELAISYAPAPPVISAVDVLEGRVPESALRDKVVFVGITDPTIGDRVLTPVDGGRGYPGVMTHVMAANTILTRAYLDPVSDVSVVLWVFLLALVVALLVQFAPLWVASVSVVAVSVAYLALAFTRMDHGVVMNFVYPTLAVVVAIPASGAVRYALEVRQRKRVNRLFAQYVPPVVARELMHGDRVAELMDGEHVRATVLFCDIRGFTPLTSGLSPRQVRILLDVYYDALSHVILEHGGTTLRYTGDEIYAVFGAPNPTPDHETVAVQTAMAMHGARSAINHRLAEAGIPPLDFGIGLHTGELVSTVVGSEVRKQYAVIGNSVNMGARLCAQAKAGEIVVSEVTFGALDLDTSRWESYQAQLKGIEGTPTLYRLNAAVTGTASALLAAPSP